MADDQSKPECWAHIVCKCHYEAGKLRQLNEIFAERIAVQSELLSRAAERKGRMMDACVMALARIESDIESGRHKTHEGDALRIVIRENGGESIA